jgi:hypothetical protein
MSSKKHSILFIVIAIAALLVFTSVAYAAHVTIDTNDGVVDTDWGSVPMLYDDGGDVTANYDIAEAWMGNDAASPSEFYFRVNLEGTGRLPIDSVLEARLDCDQDGLFNESVDITIYYWIISGPDEILLECQGDNSVCETNPDSFGEEITVSAPPYNYEWKADVSTGVGTEADWSACMGTVDVQFASGNGAATQDLTTTRGYSAPTAVTLKTFAVQNQVLPIATIVLGVVAVGSLVVIRRQKGQ